MMLSYGVVIATCNRQSSLESVIKDWKTQTIKPEKIVIVDSSSSAGSKKINNHKKNKERHNNVLFIKSNVQSSARQRNLGAEFIRSKWIVFCDDDVKFYPKMAEQVHQFLISHSEAVAVLPRIESMTHPPPGKILRLYYRLQAGYYNETYGGQLFGAGIGCFPCWQKEGEYVEANWLPSTLLWIRTHVFNQTKFPRFDGYSFGEDAFMTHKIWKKYRKTGKKLYFLKSPSFKHFCIQSGIKARRFEFGRMACQNQKILARKALGLGKREVFFKMLLHRFFMLVYLIRRRHKGWIMEALGWWSDW